MPPIDVGFAHALAADALGVVLTDARAMDLAAGVTFSMRVGGRRRAGCHAARGGDTPPHGVARGQRVSLGRTLCRLVVLGR